MKDGEAVKGPKGSTGHMNYFIHNNLSWLIEFFVNNRLNGNPVKRIEPNGVYARAVSPKAAKCIQFFSPGHIPSSPPTSDSHIQVVFDTYFLTCRVVGQKGGKLLPAKIIV